MVTPYRGLATCRQGLDLRRRRHPIAGVLHPNRLLAHLLSLQCGTCCPHQDPRPCKTRSFHALPPRQKFCSASTLSSHGRPVLPSCVLSQVRMQPANIKQCAGLPSNSDHGVEASQLRRRAAEAFSTSSSGLPVAVWSCTPCLLMRSALSSPHAAMILSLSPPWRRCRW